MKLTIYATNVVREEDGGSTVQVVAMWFGERVVDIPETNTSSTYPLDELALSAKVKA